MIRIALLLLGLSAGAAQARDVLDAAPAEIMLSAAKATQAVVVEDEAAPAAARTDVMPVAELSQGFACGVTTVGRSGATPFMAVAVFATTLNGADPAAGFCP